MKSLKEIPILFLSLVLFTGCSDDLDRNDKDGVDQNRFYFKVEKCLTWQQAQTRSGETPGAHRPYLLEMESSSGESVPLRIYTDDEIIPEHVQDNGQRTLEEPYIPNEPNMYLTRGVSVGNLSHYETASDRNNFGVIGYAYEGTWSAKKSTTKPFLFNLKAELSSGTTYAIPNNKYYWPSTSQKVKFYAFAPYTSAVSMKSTASSTGAPVMTYTVPSAVANQVDLLVASSDEISNQNNGNPVGLNFTHKLTAIQFAVGNLVGCTVKRITISGVYGQGDYNFDSGWSFTGYSANSSYTIEPNYVTTGTNTATDKVITKADVYNASGTKTATGTRQSMTLMMIPQTLTESATLTVILDNVTNPRTGLVENNVQLGPVKIWKNAEGTRVDWSEATTVTYTISSASINNVFTIKEPGGVAFSGNQNNPGNFVVTSYTWTGSGVKTSLGWTASFYQGTSAVSQPQWLKISTSSAGLEVSNYTTSGKFMIPHRSYVWTNNTNFTNLATQDANDFDATQVTHTNILKNKAARGTTSAPWDLSKHDYDDKAGDAESAQYTANCYVVNGPGVYKIPLVYGNAIENGTDNWKAYWPGKNGNTILANNGATVAQQFVDHLDQPITSPYIYNKYTANDGCIVWQDANNLLSNVTLTSDKHYLQFTVNKSTITQGNSVIAVRDASKTILWSWHIWVTDEAIDNAIPAADAYGQSFYFMPVNLGWVSVYTDGEEGEETVVNFPARGITVQLTQNTSGATNTFYLEQAQAYASSFSATAADLYEKVVKGCCPYYEWGRKDAILPGNVRASGDRPYYNSAVGKSGDVGLDANGKYTFTSIGSATGDYSIGYSIQHPFVFIYYQSSNYDWLSVSTPVDNLWNGTNGSKVNAEESSQAIYELTKTIYDPCPRYYNIPTPRSFSGFVDSEGNPRSASVFDHGYFVYTSENRSAFIYLPGVGIRTSAYNYTEDARYWLSQTVEYSGGATKGCGLVMVFSSTYLYPVYGLTGQGTYQQAIGRTIRPIKNYVAP